MSGDDYSYGDRVQDLAAAMSGHGISVDAAKREGFAMGLRAAAAWHLAQADLAPQPEQRAADHRWSAERLTELALGGDFKG